MSANQQQLFDSRFVLDFSIRWFGILSEEQQKRSNPQSSFVFSPLLAATALAICNSGASGQTAEQFLQILFNEQTAEVVNEMFGDLSKTLTSADCCNSLSLSLANSIFCERKVEMEDSFVGAVKGKYGLDFKDFDFISESQATLQTTNRLVEEKSEQKIAAFLDWKVLDEKTGCLLLNSMHFRGEWASPFDARQTVEDKFLLNSSEECSVKMMEKREAEVYFGSSPLWRVIGLPFRNAGAAASMTMYLFLPVEHLGLQSLEKMLSAETMLALIESCSLTKIKVVKVPKFKLEQQFDLKSALQRLGCFNLSNFAQISASSRLVVSNVLHQAVVEVNEAGAEAAAAGAVRLASFDEVLPIRSSDAFEAHHPFLFVIWHSASRVPLFMGKLAVNSCE